MAQMAIYKDVIIDAITLHNSVVNNFTKIIVKT